MEVFLGLFHFANQEVRSSPVQRSLPEQRCLPGSGAHCAKGRGRPCRGRRGAGGGVPRLSRPSCPLTAAGPAPLPLPPCCPYSLPAPALLPLLPPSAGERWVHQYSPAPGRPSARPAPRLRGTRPRRVGGAAEPRSRQDPRARTKECGVGARSAGRHAVPAQEPPGALLGPNPRPAPGHPPAPHPPPALGRKGARHWRSRSEGGTMRPLAGAGRQARGPK